MRRRGLPSSEKLPRVGKATLLHQSIRPGNPPPTRGRDWPQPLPSVDRAFFFSFIQGIGGGDPAFGPLPSHSEKARQGGPDGLPGDPPPCKPLLKARLCCHLQSPKARVVSELPRRAVEHLPQSLGTLLVEGVPGPSGARGSGHESIHAPLVEVMDGIAHRLLSAAEALGDSRSMLAPRARQKHLASAQGESVFRAQPGLEGFTRFFGERTYKDWSFHGPYCNSQHETYLEDALGHRAGCRELGGVARGIGGRGGHELSRGERSSEGEGGPASVVGRHGLLAQESLALAEAGRGVRRGVGEELDGEGLPGAAV